MCNNTYYIDRMLLNLSGINLRHMKMGKTPVRQNAKIDLPLNIDNCQFIDLLTQ